jgi:hypothetical protein
VSRVCISGRRFVIHLIARLFLALLVGSRLLAGGQPQQGQAPEKPPGSGIKNAGAKTAFDPTGGYEVRQIEGWTALVNKRFLVKQATLAQETLALLRQQFRQIELRVPAEAVTKLRTIHFWVEENEPHHPCMAYHPDPGWLREHGMNPEKGRCVELSNARNFLEWIRQQPWMVLHELSHGYHHQFLAGGFDNREIKSAFNDVMKTNRYKSVPRSSGKKEKAYATTNPMEYFAEASEAYFGKNDFYPFDRADLKQYDPETYTLVDKLWQ